MVDLSELSKEELIQLVGMFADHFLTIDGLWFIGVEDKFGMEDAVGFDAQAWEKFGTTEARRIKERMGIKEDGLEGLERALNYMIWVSARGFAYKTEKTENALVQTVTECRSQQTRVKTGRGEFPCKPVGIAYFREFAKVFGVDIETECLVCPPDEHPDDVWCSWKYTASKK